MILSLRTSTETFGAAQTKEGGNAEPEEQGDLDTYISQKKGKYRMGKNHRVKITRDSKKPFCPRSDIKVSCVEEGSGVSSTRDSKLVGTYGGV